MAPPDKRLAAARKRRGAASRYADRMRTHLAVLALAGCSPTVVPGGAATDAGARDLHAQPPAPDLRAPAADLASMPPADLASMPPADLAIAPDLAHPACNTQGPRDCTPGNGTGDANQCYDPPKAYWATQVNAAIEKVLNDHPEYFDFNQGFGCCPKAIQPDAYVEAVVADVVAQGLCSIRDPNDGHEIVVKLQNDCAENYNILTSGDIVRHPPKYQGVCAPAWF